MKTGIFGGTFDPLHNGHLAIASHFYHQCGLDRVLFIPAAWPPHKPAGPLASFPQRLAMTERATRGQRAFFTCDIEGQRPGRSYSVDTLNQLRQHYPTDSFYFLIGMDSLLELDSWKEFRRLPQLCHLVVAQRPGYSAITGQTELPVALQPDFCYDPALPGFRHKDGNLLIFLKETDCPISSTQVRTALRQHQPVEQLVPAVVLAYIRQHQLYGADFVKESH